MNRPELYQKSLDTLVDAYHKDELQHGNCQHCAVGNLLKEHATRMLLPNHIWSMKFMSFKNKVYVAQEGSFVRVGHYGPEVRTLPDPQMFYLSVHQYRTLDLHIRTKAAERLINASGYTTHELALIEFAFEQAPKGKSQEDWMFNGLMAVVDALDKIHENTDTVITTNQKKRFEVVA